MNATAQRHTCQPDRDPLDFLLPDRGDEMAKNPPHQNLRSTVQHIAIRGDIHKHKTQIPKAFEIEIRFHRNKSHRIASNHIAFGSSDYDLKNPSELVAHFRCPIATDRARRAFSETSRDKHEHFEIDSGSVWQTLLLLIVFIAQ